MSDYGKDVPQAEQVGNRATAFHEAGHAVAAVALGIPFDRVSILADGESLGGVICSGVAFPPDWFHTLSREECDLLERRIVVALCGPEAERVSRQTSGYSHLAADWCLVADALKPLALGAEGVRNYHDWLKERARTVVDGVINQRAIVVVAAALMERHTLTAADVVKLIGDCKKGLAQ